jgi:hypothetical protein
METCSRVDDETGRCGNELDTTGSPKWCKVCRSRYQREYKATREDMVAAKAWADSASAMKEALAKAFSVYPTVPFYGFEIAQKIGQFPAPKRSA